VLLFRFLMFALLGASALCFAFFVGTGQDRYRHWGWVILRWTLVAAFAFFGVLILERV